MKRANARWVALVAACWAVLGLGACTGSDEGTGLVEEPSRHPELDDFGRTVFTAFLAGDTVTLERHRLSESEHNGEIYPELPVGQAGTFPVDMAWENIQLRHYRDRRRQIQVFEGRQASYTSTECHGPTRTFATFEVMTDCWVVFHDEALGPARVQLFKDVLIRDGEYLRAFRYYDGEPRRYGGSPS